jgi:glycerol dehydrogenase-like iron-containing ADH family enzyme
MDTSGGGFAAGFADGLGNAFEAASVKRNVEEACLARYGWEEVRVPVDG